VDLLLTRAMEHSSRRAQSRGSCEPP
jgi:hypothetical protein